MLLDTQLVIICDVLCSQSLGFVLRKKTQHNKSKHSPAKQQKTQKINLKLGLVASYDVRPRNGGALF